MISSKAAEPAAQANGAAAAGAAGGGKNGTDGKDEPKGMSMAADAKAFLTAALDAKSQDGVADKLVDHVLEELTGVEARWLGGVKPVFRKLLEAARNEDLTDARFIAVLEKAAKEMPDLFKKMDAKALSDAFESAMGAACVNGAVQGFMKRKV